jgi:hypothetical protein
VGVGIIGVGVGIIGVGVGIIGVGVGTDFTIQACMSASQ